jgi:VanZ family protein
MTTPTSPFPGPRAHLVLALAVMAFAIYVSLLPFHLRPADPAGAWRSFLEILFAVRRHTSRSNYLANLLLFVPIGYGLLGAWILDRPARPRLPGLPLLLAASVAVSVTAEYLQMFAPGRIPSATDIEAQTLGCVAGFAVWGVAGSSVTGWLRATLARQSPDRAQRLLLAYACAWVLINLAPFDITIDLGELAARVRRGLITIEPFASDARALSARIWDGLMACVTAAPLGALGLVAWKPPGSRRTAVRAFVLAAGGIALVELAQIFIASHAADATDVVLGWLGAAGGIAIGLQWLHAQPEDRTRAVVLARRRWSLPASLAWVGVIALYHWMPYDFTADSAMIRHRLATLSLVPFASYAAGSDLQALNTFLTKMALAAPLGLLSAPVTGSASRAAILARVAGAAIVFTGIEAGQLFLPTRVPDPSDVLVGTMGYCAGLAVAIWLPGRGSSNRA